MLSDLDLAWLAGLIEGEGTFDSPRRVGGRGGSYRGCVITVGMTDEDVVARFARLVGAKSYHSRPGRDGRLALYSCTISEPYAIVLMLRLYPLMGLRRQQRIAECIQTTRQVRWPLPEDCKDLWTTLRETQRK